MKIIILLLICSLTACANMTHEIRPKIKPKTDLIFCKDMDNCRDIFLQSEISITYTCRF